MKENLFQILANALKAIPKDTLVTYNTLVTILEELARLQQKPSTNEPQ